jgi:hypothetical protein
MKFQSAFNPFSFDRLTGLFEKISESSMQMKHVIGEGTVHAYNLARGLQVRIWNCCFHQQLLIAGDENKGIDPAYFTLAFFLNTNGFRLENKGTLLPESIIWDTIFISDRSNCKMDILPGIPAQCLSISFTEKWLKKNVLEKTAAKWNLKEKVYNSEAFSLLGSMTAAEKKLVKELLDVSGKSALGTFYLKCSVFKIISDFLVKLKERSPLF